MNLKDCFLLGRFGKTVGNKGEIHLKLDVDSPENYYEMESVFALLGGRLIPFFFTSTRPASKGRIVVKIEDLDSPDQVQNLVGAHAYLPLALLPEPEEDSFYLHDAIGAEVHDEALGFAGKVKGTIDLGNQSLFEIEFHDKTYLLPIVDDLVKSLETHPHILHVSLPEGLIDLGNES